MILNLRSHLKISPCMVPINLNSVSSRNMATLLSFFSNSPFLIYVLVRSTLLCLMYVALQSITRRHTYVNERTSYDRHSAVVPNGKDNR